jgi:hypothetical protein
MIRRLTTHQLVLGMLSNHKMMILVSLTIVFIKYANLSAHNELLINVSPPPALLPSTCPNQSGENTFLTSGKLLFGDKEWWDAQNGTEGKCSSNKCYKVS